MERKNDERMKKEERYSNTEKPLSPHAHLQSTTSIAPLLAAMMPDFS